MEEQQLLYQFYYLPEQNQKHNFVPAHEKSNLLQHHRKHYTELGGVNTNRVLPISLACLSRCSSKSYVEISDNESTPLLNCNANLRKKLSTKGRRVLLLMFVLFYVVFLILGSFTFRTFEMTEELKERQLYQDVREGFVMKYPNVLGRSYSFFLV